MLSRPYRSCVPFLVDARSLAPFHLLPCAMYFPSRLPDICRRPPFTCWRVQPYLSVAFTRLHVMMNAYLFPIVIYGLSFFALPAPCHVLASCDMVSEFPPPVIHLLVAFIVRYHTPCPVLTDPYHPKSELGYVVLLN